MKLVNEYTIYSFLLPSLMGFLFTKFYFFFIATAPVGGQSTTVGAVTSVPGAGGCPAFDFSTCDPNCVVMDAQGCLSCHCAGNSSHMETY